MEQLINPDLWIVLAAAAAGLLIAFAARWAALYSARRRNSDLAAALARRVGRPLLWLVPLACARAVQPLLHVRPDFSPIIRHAITLLLITLFAWVIIAVIHAIEETIHGRVAAEAQGSVRVRRLLTRAKIASRIATGVISVLALAWMLMTFQEARAVGASILASAGVAGLVLGIAARPAAETLIAGLQIALTDSLHVEDVVIVEGEWGRVEEITATYVVVRIWDLRRLILPISYFIEKPFQNWTRSGSELLATVTLDVDYTMPVPVLRERAGVLLAASPNWDHRTWNVQVVDAGDRTMKVRVLASAVSADAAWDLRCEIREALIAFLQQGYPWALPRTRTHTDPVSVRVGGAAPAGAAGAAGAAAASTAAPES